MMEDGGFLVRFRERREERSRLESLKARAETERDSADPDVAERVIAELARRAAELEQTERVELKGFVSGLKERREELRKTEQDLAELDFRRHIGELEEVEVEIRRESLSLKARETKRNLEKELEEYRALRRFIDENDDQSAESGSSADRSELDQGVAQAESDLRETKPPVRREVPPPRLEAGQESIIVNQDFVASAPAEEELDDLSQLDVLAQTLDQMSPSQGDDLAPVPMPEPIPSGESSAQMLDGIPSTPLLAEEENDSGMRTGESSTSLTGEPMLILKGRDGAERASYLLRPGVSTIGRGLDNECVLDDRAVSRKHATLASEGDGEFRITDLGSENGTYVNGVRITSQLLKDGDEVHMGKSTLVFSAGR